MTHRSADVTDSDRSLQRSPPIPRGTAPLRWMRLGLLSFLPGIAGCGSELMESVLDRLGPGVAETWAPPRECPVPLPTGPAANTVPTTELTFPADPSLWEMKVGGGLVHGAARSWEPYVLPVDILAVDGRWHMLYMGVRFNRAKGVVDLERSFGIAVSHGDLLDPCGWIRHEGNPVLTGDGPVYPETQATDWGVLTAAIGRGPDGSLRLHDGRWIMHFGAYDGRDSTIRWASSPDGVDWSQQGETGITVATGGGDPDEVWMGHLVFNPADSLWYSFYHSGGDSRVLDVASGRDPTQMSFRAQLLDPGEAARVFRDRESWVMIYQPGERGLLHFARSFDDDLTTWEPLGPALNVGPWGTSESILIPVAEPDGRVAWRVIVNYWDYFALGGEFARSWYAEALVDR